MKDNIVLDLRGMTPEEFMEKLFNKNVFPELITDMDIWKVIKALDMIIQQTKSRTDESEIAMSAKNELFLSTMRYIRKELIEKLIKEYDIISETKPKISPIPDGKTYYTDWYISKEEEFYKSAFDGIICAYCPFCKENGAEILKSQLPCSAFRGGVTNLEHPWICLMIEYGQWTERDLFKKIKEETSEDYVEAFKEKIKELKIKI